ncbi:MAG TPA: PadR family transcriptional regulator [Candidatus Dormibacteraeota bacterium]
MYLDILILFLLSDRPAHGYELKKRVEHVMGAAVTLNNNVLYPALHRFEAMGAVERNAIVVQQGRPSRHVYALTDVGRDVLGDLIRDFPPADAIVDAEFRTRVACFDLVDEEVRREIVEARLAALRGRLAQLRRLSDEAAGSAWSARLIDFLLAHREWELGWTATLLGEEASVDSRGRGQVHRRGAPGEP